MAKASQPRHYCWDRLPAEELSSTITRTFLSGERVMLAHLHLKRGAVVPRHEHANEQLTYILRGHLRFWTGEEAHEEAIDVRAGEVLHLPSHLLHRVEALEDTLDLDIFSPPREDWLTGADAYLRT